MPGVTEKSKLEKANTCPPGERTTLATSEYRDGIESEMTKLRHLTGQCWWAGGD